MNENIAADECKHCDNDGEPVKGKKTAELPNGDQIYLCLRCIRIWGVDKFGERIEGNNGQI